MSKSYKNHLQELCVARGFPPPSYTHERNAGADHMPIWVVRASAMGITLEKKGHNIKQTEKDLAYNIYNQALHYEHREKVVAAVQEKKIILFVDIDIENNLQERMDYDKYTVHTFSRFERFIEDAGAPVTHKLPYNCDERSIALAIAFTIGTLLTPEPMIVKIMCKEKDIIRAIVPARVTVL